MTFLKHRAIVQEGEIVPPVDEELFTAAKTGDAAKLRERLAAGTPADHPYGDEECMTPLIYAVQGGHHECMRILLEAGADIHLLDHKVGHSPLRAAIHKNDAKAIEILLEFNADPFHRSVGTLPDGTRHEYLSDEDLAHKLCDTEVAEMVTAARAKFRVNEMAHRNINNPELMKELLAQGVPVDIKNDNGQTALHYAVLHGNYDTARLLLEAGADPEIEWHGKGHTALRLAFHASAQKAGTSIIELLLSHGANIHGLDERGRNMAHTAASTGDLGILKIVGASGVSLTGLDAEGKTPAEAAREWSDKVDAAPVIEKAIEIEEIGRKAQRLDNPIKAMKKISFGRKA